LPSVATFALPSVGLATLGNFFKKNIKTIFAECLAVALDKKFFAEWQITGTRQSIF
jgi:hypothetical protein